MQRGESNEEMKKEPVPVSVSRAPGNIVISSSMRCYSTTGHVAGTYLHTTVKRDSGTQTSFLSKQYLARSTATSSSKEI